MYLTRIELEGARGFERLSAPGTRGLSALPAGPSGTALADAMLMLAATLDPGRLEAVARRFGWWGPDSAVLGEAGDAELIDLHAATVSSAIADELRTLTVDAAFALDPPLYGRLREHAAREPRLVTALGQSPSVSVKVGWVFSLDRRAVSPSVLTVRIGEVGFEAHGKERPTWLPDLLRRLGARIQVTQAFEPVSDVAERLLASSLSPDPATRSGYTRALECLVGPPFSLPAPGLVRAGGRVELVFGPDLHRARQLGRAALDAVRWSEAAHVSRPDVLVVDEGVDKPVRRWLAALAESDDAPVEQVWVR